MIEIAVLGVPVGKGRPRFSRDGHTYTPERTRTFEGMLNVAAQEAMGERPPLEGPLKLEMEVVVPIAKSWPKKRQSDALKGILHPTSKPDWDNFGKVVDALNLVVWRDDSQVCDGRVKKRYGEKPGMWIRVWPMTDEGVFA